MGLIYSALHHLTKRTKPNSRRHYRMARAVAEVLEQRVLLSSFVVTSLADSGAGSLRAEIAAANANPGVDAITFQAGLTGTITLTTGQLELSDTSGATTITGPGANLLAVSGNNASRVFRIDSSVTVALSGLTITDGQGPASEAGGGILTYGTLTLSDSIFTNNSSFPQGGGGLGSGVGSNTTITNCTFSSDTGYTGGGIYNSGQMTIADTTISGNSATGTTIYTGGGGIQNVGTLNIIASTISNNTSTASDGGGGIFNDGTTTISNSTIAGNSAVQGGGIYDPFGLLTLTNCTISANTGDGITAAVTLNNTIVAGNTAQDGVTPADLNTSSATGSYNLIGTGGSGGLINGVNGNLVGVADAMLGPLQNNGGSTETMALLAGSPAIAEGSNVLALAGNVTTDQRGDARGAPLDIGAYEFAKGDQTTANQTYISQLYQDILHRSADGPGLANWAAQLTNGTETYQQVALGFTNSLENYENVVRSYFQTFLGRAPDLSELGTYTGQIVAGTPSEAIAVEIASLQEFFNNSGGTNDGFITALYNDVLARPADTAGRTNWDAVLGTAPLIAVAGGVIYSAENYNNLVGGFYQTYLHRAATSDEVAAGEGEFVSGINDQTIIAGIVSSPEYLALNNVT